MGVWLPLAAAQICQLLTFIAGANTKDGLKVPTTSQALRSFALPAMAEAMECEEDEREARSMVEALKTMAGKTGGKVEIKRGEK